MKTILIGELTEVMPVEVAETYKKQRITIVIQEYNRDTGEKMRREVFQPVIFNKAIDSCRAQSFIGKKVLAVCWVRSFETEKDGKKYHNLSLNCSDLQQA